MQLSINQARDEKEIGGIKKETRVWPCLALIQYLPTQPTPRRWEGKAGCVYRAVSHVGNPLPGDAGHQGDEKIIAPSVRACRDKVWWTPAGINRPQDRFCPLLKHWQDTYSHKQVRSATKLNICQTAYETVKLYKTQEHVYLCGLLLYWALISLNLKLKTWLGFY